jgi:Zn finger protein HypA/HybF involved in hydrogenase expression
MLLSEGESEVLREHVVPYRWGERTGRATVHLTNVRLVLEQPPRGGLLSSGVAWTVLELPLRNVTNASVGSVLRRARYVSLETNVGVVRLDVVDPPKFLAAFTAARAGVRHPASPPAAAPTLTIERHVVKIRCRHCGTLSEERQSRCPSCGASL